MNDITERLKDLALKNGSCNLMNNVAICDDAISTITELRSKLAIATEILKRIRQWDALDIPDSDGNFWKKELDKALSAVGESNGS